MKKQNKTLLLMIATGIAFSVGSASAQRRRKAQTSTKELQSQLAEKNEEIARLEAECKATKITQPTGRRRAPKPCRQLEDARNQKGDLEKQLEPVAMEDEAVGAAGRATKAATRPLGAWGY